MAPLRFFNELRQWSIVPPDSIVPPIVSGRTVLPNASYPGGTVGGVAYGAIFYVATNGVDVPAGGTVTAPWLTLTYAMTQITTAFDFQNQAVLLQAVTGHAAFTEHFWITPWEGAGSLAYDGANGSITYAGTAARFDANLWVKDGALPGPFTFQNVMLVGTNTFANFYVSSASHVVIGGGVVLAGGSAISYQMLMENGGARIDFPATVANSITVGDGSAQSGSAAQGFIFGNAAGDIFAQGTATKIIFANSVTYGVTVGGQGAPFIFLGAVTWDTATHGVTVTNTTNPLGAGVAKVYMNLNGIFFDGTGGTAVAGTGTPQKANGGQIS